MSDDPFAVLGLDPTAGEQDVLAARRDLARRHHPDRGGDPERMRTINAAADAALRAIESGTDVVPTAEPRRDPEATAGLAHDVPSFTVEALPVETFEALLVVATWLGEVLDDDPPYRLDVHLDEPPCWCRLDLVPDAGSSSVSLVVGGLGDVPTPDVVAVRDLWIVNLNTLDWP
jgi:hypothetical protein